MFEYVKGKMGRQTLPATFPTMQQVTQFVSVQQPRAVSSMVVPVQPAAAEPGVTILPSVSLGGRVGVRRLQMMTLTV